MAIHYLAYIQAFESILMVYYIKWIIFEVMIAFEFYKALLIFIEPSSITRFILFKARIAVIKSRNVRVDKSSIIS